MAHKTQDKRNTLDPAYNMVLALLSLSLEKSEGGHKSGQYVKVVKRMTRSITFFWFQDILNCFTKTLQ